MLATVQAKHSHDQIGVNAFWRCNVCLCVQCRDGNAPTITSNISFFSSGSYHSFCQIFAIGENAREEKREDGKKGKEEGGEE